MVGVTDKELVFSFLDVDEEAVLSVSFCKFESLAEPLRIDGSLGEGLRLATTGRFVMCLQPRFPMALLLSVRGRNVITGELTTTLCRSPQNYFSTPPQGGIDGYYLDGRVHPFRASMDPHPGETRLEITVFPMKREAMEYFRARKRLIPGWGPTINGLTLAHGGVRQCEPIYEDLCSQGDWDMNRHERAMVWVNGGS